MCANVALTIFLLWLLSIRFYSVKGKAFDFHRERRHPSLQGDGWFIFFIFLHCKCLAHALKNDAVVTCRIPFFHSGKRIQKKFSILTVMKSEHIRGKKFPLHSIHTFLFDGMIFQKIFIHFIYSLFNFIYVLSCEGTTVQCARFKTRSCICNLAARTIWRRQWRAGGRHAVLHSGLELRGPGPQRPPHGHRDRGT